ncbi:MULTISPECIES: preprotein translocase subunit YajC [Selenomonas]|uniref:Preprotein translocase subunit YajC n=1 Tax=Selenomonas ruminis TaxID=2593411 RepID=A0A5D6WDS9_9FIRM|nr:MULTISPECIES: preprotein translocase subunit YajC [unclassified Selenomonas]MBQ1868485.1 preprotein translocase subunit YajC [Selenomonas sp.]TYZ24684.1 preprotein translocase subunit YajC [Selenomonas sp. mPRGC5]
MNPEMAAGLATWGPIIVMIAIFYFLLYRPQKTAQKRRMSMLDSLEKHNHVMTIGGIYGTIVDLDDTKVKLKIAENTVIEVARSSINSNLTKEKQA